MVTCRLFGRLGNQMFQIAAALGYAYDYKVPFVLPLKTANDKTWPNYFYGKFADGQKYDWMIRDRFIEPSHAYTKIPRFQSGVRLDGYFQSYKYFIDHIDRVRSDFEFSRNTMPGAVAVHIRRGDYLDHPTKHPVVTFEYLRTAFSIFSVEARFLVFSDDIDWCKKALSSMSKGRNITFVLTGDPLDNMRLMASCEHAIVANSSYSVMAAILNPSPTKEVVCPHENDYFGIDNKHLDVSTLMPPDWIRVKF